MSTLTVHSEDSNFIQFSQHILHISFVQLSSFDPSAHHESLASWMSLSCPQFLHFILSSSLRDEKLFLHRHLLSIPAVTTLGSSTILNVVILVRISHIYTKDMLYSMHDNDNDVLNHAHSFHISFFKFLFIITP